jgi:hypothetical protein
MKSCCRMSISAALLVVALTVSASAGSITYKLKPESVTGSKSTIVTPQFTFNSNTDKITGTLTFKGGIFNGITDSFSGTAKCNKKSGICSYTFFTTVKGDKISYTIDLSQWNHWNLTAAFGSIWNWKYDGTFCYTNSYAKAPEGGSRFSYLAPAGFMIFGGIFLSGFRRQRAGTKSNG